MKYFFLIFYLVFLSVFITISYGYLNAAEVSIHAQEFEKNQTNTSPILKQSLKIKETERTEPLREDPCDVEEIKPSREERLIYTPTKEPAKTKQWNYSKPQNKEQQIAFTDNAVGWDAVEKKFLQNIDKSAAAIYKRFSQDAKDEFVKQAFWSKSIKGPIDQKKVYSKEETTEILSAISEKAQGGKITPVVVMSGIKDWTIEKVKPTIPEMIFKNAKIVGINPTMKLSKLLQADLLLNTEGLAKSGFYPEIIKTRNEEFLKTIFSLISSSKMTEKEYKKAKKIIFRRLVRLTISSSPIGADVEVAGNPIGRTTIERKPFEAGKEYSFLFKLVRYKYSQRSYYVAPYPLEQQFSEILIPQKK